MSATRARLRLLTWNLGRLHLGAFVNRLIRLDSRAADSALAHVARVIEGAGAEVVALQELRGPAQLERLVALLGGDWRAAAPEGERGDRRVGLLARRRLDPRFAAVETPTGRATQTASLRVAALGERWVVASIHLDAFDEHAREAQARQLRAWAASDGARALVLAGDLNIDLAHPAARRRRDPATLGALADGLVDLGARAGATCLGGRRLDYVLARRAVAGRAEVLRGRRVPLGDHHPLLAHLESSLPEGGGSLTEPDPFPSIGTAMEHRRADQRHEHQLSVEFTFEGLTHVARTRNVSLGGLFLVTDLPLPYGARLELRFAVPTQREPIEVGGQVRWTTVRQDAEGAGVGVRFDGLRARDVWALNKFFDRPEG